MTKSTFISVFLHSRCLFRYSVVKVITTLLFLIMISMVMMIRQVEGMVAVVGA